MPTQTKANIKVHNWTSLHNVSAKVAWNWANINTYKICMDCFFIINILDHACTTCFVFANSFCKFFSKSFCNIVKGKWIRFLRSIFKFWNFLPLFQMLFLWVNKTPPQINSPLSVQEGFKISSFENTTCSPFRTQRDTNLKFTNWKSLILKIRVVVRSFCFGPILSPPLAWIAKNRYLEWNIGPWRLHSPLW